MAFYIMIENLFFGVNIGDLKEGFTNKAWDRFKD